MFCPLAEIQEALERTRVEAGAECMLLLSIDSMTELRSLTMLAVDQNSESESLVSLLKPRDPKVSAAKAEMPLWRRLDNRGVTSCLHRLDAWSRQQSGGLGNEFHAELIRLHASLPWRIMGGFQPNPVAPVNCILFQRGGSAPRGAKRVVANLSSMINATANASVHRDAKVTLEVERATSSIANDATEEEQLWSLLSMACDVTASQSGVVYVIDQTLDEPSLTARARIGSTALAKASIQVKKSRDVPATLGGAAYRRRRPLLLENPQDVAPEYSSLWHHQAAAFSEIVVPIPSAPGATDTPYAGILACGREGEGATPYGSYDFALLRNVALRIALLRADKHMREFASRLTEVGEAASATEGEASMQKHLTITPSARNRAWDAAVDDPDIPSDLALALPHAGPLLETAARITASHSATLRLLVPVHKHAPGEQFQLKRAVSWPKQRLGDPFASLALRDSSVNSYVARTGRHVTIADTKDPRAYLDYPGLNKSLSIPERSTRAEICLPLTVDHRLVGTLNFESPAPNAYAHCEEIALGCSAQIAVLLSSLRRTMLKEVVSIGSDVQASAHELAKLRRRVPREDPSGIARDVHEVLDRVIGSLDALDDPTASSSTAHSLQQLILAASDAAGIRVTLHDIRHDAPNWTARDARRLFLAFFEIMRNIQSYGILTEGGYPVITVGRNEVGGAHYYVVNIEHGYLPAKSPNTRAIYRIPTIREDGLHFGAYGAGAMLRDLGGDVFTLRQTRDLKVSILVSVPVESLGAANA